MKGREHDNVRTEIVGYSINEYGDIVAVYKNIVIEFKNEEQADGSFRFVEPVEKDGSVTYVQTGSNIFENNVYPMRTFEKYDPVKMVWEYSIYFLYRLKSIVQVTEENKNEMRRKFNERNFIMDHADLINGSTCQIGPSRHLGRYTDTDGGSYVEGPFIWRVGSNQSD